MAGNESHILDQLRHDRLVAGANVQLIRLGGGISSDVFLVENQDRRFVVKQALPRLKVKDDWPADTSRNRVEYEFLRYLRQLLPDAAPAVFSVGEDYFVMEFLGGEYHNWKQLLLRGRCEPQHAERAAKILGTLHRASFGDSQLARTFDTTRNFHQLRTDPYLITTGRRHPALRERFEQGARRLEETRECLVHGDYSPKNMLIGHNRTILLDCEVAWYGDPAFDLAFLLNHLLLKALYHAPLEAGLYTLIVAAIRTYYRERKMEPDCEGDFDTRTTELLLMLLLARIDGKSPVEYLSSEQKREFVRRFVSARICARTLNLNALVSEWFDGLRTGMTG